METKGFIDFAQGYAPHARCRGDPTANFPAV
jgi:hypothetical protein